MSEILLGFKDLAPSQTAGFRPKTWKDDFQKEPLFFNGRSHILTVAPTGSGKGVGCIIPNLLSYEGPTIVLDPKGENLNVTYRKRKEMGHEIYVLDPFSITNHKSARFNPLDMKHLKNFDAGTDAFSLAYQFSGNGFSTDPYWDDVSRTIIAGLIQYVWSQLPVKDQHFGTIRSMIADDLSYKLAVILDTVGKKLPKPVYDAFSLYLNLPSDKTRPCVDSTMGSYFSGMYSEKIEEFMSKSTFSLSDIVDAKPIDIFIVFPPDKLQSHSKILRLMLSVFFKAITSRKVMPKDRTLIILDECASLGAFPDLESMYGISRGYGCCIHSVFQDIAQIRRFYKEGMYTILNNSGAWQLFGAYNYTTANDISSITGIPVYDVQKLGANQQIVVIEGQTYMPAGKSNYLSDDSFKGQFDQNPFYAL